MIILPLVVIISKVVLCLPINSGDQTDKEIADKISPRVESSNDELFTYDGQQENDDHDDDEDNDDLHDEDNQDFCLICHDDFLIQPPANLACGHKYHIDCLIEWIEFGRRCNKPTECFFCKQELTLVDRRGLNVTDIYYYAKLQDVAKNKLKMGLQSSRLELPTHWQEMPEDLSEGEHIY